MTEQSEQAKLPELPEPAGVIIVGTQALRAFTADQMRAFYAAGVAAERERAAKICDEIEQRYWDAWKRDADNYAQGQSDGAGECGTAIRATPKEG